MERFTDQTFVFIDAWNERAEGPHLEPDQRFVLADLEASRQAVLGKSGTASAPDPGPGSTSRQGLFLARSRVMTAR
jgi:hypothetical protein